jgi:hypothetical protein
MGEEIISAGTHASTAKEGISKLSVAPAVATNPISCGDNDERLHPVLPIKDAADTNLGMLLPPDVTEWVPDSFSLIPLKLALTGALITGLAQYGTAERFPYAYLPVPTASTIGAVKAGSNVTIDENGSVSVAAPYTLPVSTALVLGGVKIGSNVSVTGDGTISVAAPYTLPIAAAGSLGGIRVGSGLSIDGDGILSATGVGGGTVTSVGLALPSSEFDVAGGTNPVVGSGTLTGAWKVQTANYGFMGPTSGAAAAPTFRALVAADIPGSTVGKAVLALTNPGAISFPRFNVDNSVSALSASGIRTAMGVGTSDQIECARIYQDQPLVYSGTEVSIVSPYETKSGAYKGSIHNHTTGSDGVDTPTALVTFYKNLGYDFVSITDHDVLTADPAVADILFIPGVEESPTTGHIVSLDATRNESSLLPQEIIDGILVQGALPILAHPVLPGIGFTPAEAEVLEGFIAMEVYNAYAAPQNSEAIWDIVLSKGVCAYGIGVDDTHNAAANAGKAWITVFSDALTKAAIKESVYRGNFYASTGATLAVSVSGRVITATTGSVSTIAFIGNGGATLQSSASATSASYTVVGNERYVRIKITRDSDSKNAWSNPIYVLRTPWRDWTRGGLIQGRTQQAVIDTGVENISGYRMDFQNNPTTTCAVNKYAIYGTHTIPSTCAQTFSATQYGLFGLFEDVGSGTRANVVGLRGRCILSGTTSGTNAYGGSNTVDLTGAVTLSGVVTGNHGAVSLQNAGATVSGQISGVWAELISNAGIADGPIASFYAGAVTGVALTGTRPNLDGFAHGAITGTGFAAASMFRTGNVTGATVVRQLDLGTGLSHLSDTTEATSATSASLGTLGGIYATKKIKTASAFEGASLSVTGTVLAGTDGTNGTMKMNRSTGCIETVGQTTGGGWAYSTAYTQTDGTVLGAFGGYGVGSGGEPTLSYLWIGPAYNDTTWAIRIYPSGIVRMHHLTASSAMVTNANKDVVSLTPASAATAAAAAPSVTAGTYGWASDANRLTVTTALANAQTRIAEIYAAVKAAKIMS